MGRFFLLFIILTSSMTACLDLNMQHTFNDLSPGQWRGVFTLDAEKVPVQFNVNNRGDSTCITFLNGEYKTTSAAVEFWGDTLTVPFDEGIYLKVIYEVDKMEGYLYDRNQAFYPITFLAQQGQLNRFPDVRKEPVMDITGTWDISLNGTDSTIHTTLVVKATKNRVDAQTVINNKTITMSGVIQDDVLVLSGFNGKAVAYLEGKIIDGTIQRAFILTNKDKFTIVGTKNKN